MAMAKKPTSHTWVGSHFICSGTDCTVGLTAFKPYDKLRRKDVNKTQCKQLKKLDILREQLERQVLALEVITKVIA